MKVFFFELAEQISRLVVYKLIHTKLTALTNVNSPCFACPLIYVLENIKMQMLEIRKIQLAIRERLF